MLIKGKRTKRFLNFSASFLFPMTSHGTEFRMLARKFLCKVQKRCKLHNNEFNNRYCHHYSREKAQAYCTLIIIVRWQWETTEKATVNEILTDEEIDSERRKIGTEIHDLIKLNYGIFSIYVTWWRKIERASLTSWIKFRNSFVKLNFLCLRNWRFMHVDFFSHQFLTLNSRTRIERRSSLIAFTWFIWAERSTMSRETWESSECHPKITPRNMGFLG